MRNRRKDRLTRWLAAAGLAVAVAGPAAALGGATQTQTSAAGGLPPVECVRLLRAARIAAMKDDPAGELALLRQAEAAFPDEIAPLNALLEYHGRNPLPADEHQRLRERLLARLGDPALVIPPGVIEQMAADPHADPETLRAMAAKVAAQLGDGSSPDPRLLAVLAGLQERLGDDAAALASWQRLWRSAGAERAIEPMLRLSASLGRWSDAADLLKGLVDRGDVGFRRFYITALGKLGRFDEVLRQLDLLIAEEARAEQAAGTPEQAPSADPSGSTNRGSDVADLLEDTAWALRDAGHDADAERLFRRALAYAPKSRELLAVVANLYATDEERAAAAGTLAERWQKVTDARVLLDEGTQRLASGDAAGALDLLKRAAPEYPKLEAPWYNLGIAAFKLHDWATAEMAYGHAAELNPARADSFYFRGVALTYLERWAEAVAALRQALKVDPGRVDAHYHLAVCDHRLGRDAEAAEQRKLYEAAKKPGS
jgi:tetratricopeptide (TPR) repeat protein